MKAKKPYCRTAIFAAFLLMILWGCAGKSFEPNAPGEIPKGPGIFSKEKGVVILYDDAKKTNAESAGVEQGSPQAPSAASERHSDASFEEFEAYKRWLEWKKSAGGSPEYEEFKQWREWKQYQEWKNRQ